MLIFCMWTYFIRSLSSGSRWLAGRRAARGFTLVELLVVSLIIVLVTGVILFRQQAFNSSTLLRSLAYSVALSVRQAQVYGVSVREQTGVGGMGTGSFAKGYGVRFNNVGCTGDGVPHSYQLFSDINGNSLVDSGEELPCYKVGNGRGTDYKVVNFCAHPLSGGASICYANPSVLSSLIIYFRRPNPDACIATSDKPNACLTPTTAPEYDYAYIQLQSQGSSDVRTVKVTNTGQITVCKLNVADVSAC